MTYAEYILFNFLQSLLPCLTSTLFDPPKGSSQKLPSNEGDSGCCSGEYTAKNESKISIGQISEPQCWLSARIRAFIPCFSFSYKKWKIAYSLDRAYCFILFKGNA